MTLRYHEIAEANHRILNAITESQLMLLGEICRLRPEWRQLDLACGKGEMLCRWAERYKIRGTGVDKSKYFLSCAKRRAEELGVADHISFECHDATDYLTDAPAFDVVSCIGATWIGHGIIGTIEMLKKAVNPEGLILIGEPYWISEPPEEAYEAMQFGKDEFTSLEGTADRCAAAGVELIEMVLANPDSWDRYVAAQWYTISDWLRANKSHEDAPAMKEFLERSRSSHLKYGRRYLGWGIFVLRPTPLP